MVLRDELLKAPGLAGSFAEDLFDLRSQAPVCVQTTGPPVTLPHYLATRLQRSPLTSIDMDSLSTPGRSECCSAPQNLALASPDPELNLIIHHVIGNEGSEVTTVNSERHVRLVIPQQLLKNLSAFTAKCDSPVNGT